MLRPLEPITQNTRVAVGNQASIYTETDVEESIRKLSNVELSASASSTAFHDEFKRVAIQELDKYYKTLETGISPQQCLVCQSSVTATEAQQHIVGCRAALVRFAWKQRSKKASERHG